MECPSKGGFTVSLFWHLYFCPLFHSVDQLSPETALPGSSARDSAVVSARCLSVHLSVVLFAGVSAGRLCSPIPMGRRFVYDACPSTKKE